MKGIRLSGYKRRDLHSQCLHYSDSESMTLHIGKTANLTISSHMMLMQVVEMLKSMLKHKLLQIVVQSIQLRLQTPNAHRELVV